MQNTEVMSFFNPGILYGLALAALPIIIHLINLRKYRKMYFSSLWFLKNIQYQTRKSRRLHEWLILLMRTLLIASLVIAFAGPYLDRGMKESGKALHLIVDNTQSMQSSNSEGNLFDQVKDKSYEIFDALDANQLVNLHFLGNGSSHWNLDKKGAKDLINQTGLEHGNYSINSMVKKIYKKQQEAPKLVILSDFQKNIIQTDTIFQDTNLFVNLLNLNHHRHNISIDSIWFESPLQIPGQSKQLNVLISNHANKEVNELPVQINMNGQLLSAGTANIAPLAQEVYKTSIEINDPGLVRIKAHIENSPITFDNEYYSGIFVSPKIQILETGKAASNYLAALFNDDEFFTHRFLKTGNIPLSTLSEAQTIILQDAVGLSAGMANAIMQNVSNGSNLIFIPNIGESTTTTNQLLEKLNLPGIVDLVKDTTLINELNLRHPLFSNAIERFDDDMSLPPIGPYYQLNISQNATPLLYNDLDDPVLFQLKKGNGNVYLFAFNALQSNFATHPLFIPLMFNAASIRNKNIIPQVTCNEPSTIRVSNIQGEGEIPLRIRQNGREFIPYTYLQQNTTILSIRQNQITMPGFYKIMYLDSVVNLLAANHHQSESEMEFYSVDVLEDQIFRTANTAIFDIGSSADEILRPIQKLWKYFIIFALLMIIAEIALLFSKERQHKMKQGD